uniref:Activator of Hsp90 ATPase AHSA1-like N-terminal domain-containing protein n=1 Tax=Fagus sylvatica TaxID=28930 RepID=A0A2N9G3L8_FAGSY
MEMEAEKKQEEVQQQGGEGGASYTYWVRQVRNEDAAPLPVPRKLTPNDILNSNSQPPSLGSLWNTAGTWEEKNLNKWASDRIKELLVSVGSLELPSGKAEISDVSKCVGDGSIRLGLTITRSKKSIGPSILAWTRSRILLDSCLSTWAAWLHAMRWARLCQARTQFADGALAPFQELEFLTPKLLLALPSKEKLKSHLNLKTSLQVFPLLDLLIPAFLVTVRNKKRVGYTYELTLKVKGEWTIREEKKMVKGHIDIPEFSFGELDDLQMEVKLSEEKDLLHQDKSRISQDLKLFMQPVREKLLQFEQELKDR